MRKLIILMLLAGMTFAQEVVELNLPNTSKIIVMLRFMNGTVTDPAGKEGLTYATTNLVTQGGSEKLTYSEIQDIMYPMAAQYGGFVDKEVATFSFQVHVDHLDKFYPVFRDLILTPAFSEDDFKRVMINQQNYVDQVVRALMRSTAKKRWKTFCSGAHLISI
jgi:zinc protease